MMRIGIDLGSRSVKVIKKEGDQIVAKEVFDSFQFYTNFLKDSTGKHILKNVGSGEVVITGYGKFSSKVEGANKISEVEAHVRGAKHQTGLTDFTLLDIGGQDTKVIKVEGGQAINFTMNDKCAAGSGRFLENMCKILDVSMEELSKHAGEGPTLSSTCAIFAESELIAKIIDGYSLDELCAGVNRTLILRTLPMIKRHLEEKLVFVGGGAKSPAIKQMLEQELKIPVIIPREPQFNGALGCVLS
ncbi:MAG: 2-hydroxyglutaryl-CoA dehydratase [Candidatus Margulisbacteria bacterium]|nr:2-hydroxyglutaryl-CoA dehydratase [Candidatus Margulisiibacteriota bacterium]MBU1021712.1 2-hydroxyglutaryl-CoA dehydratase [Candidatus Margulisiibacteriota bacterium]MBU1729458.1 2-hydroxyglutaryl-CoA dehydratase [Candidatus Margulisiibacteriota bacterium]MBU1955441.1 2-hydroxyglutaryl-CoA dehydratase [Candidatus Margulisiibacteriota bacterium]